MNVKILIFTLSLLSGCSAKPYVLKHTEASTMAGEAAVYVVNHGWHTGFVVPAQTIQEQLPELKARFGNTPFLEFGWGDQGFYQAGETTTGLILKAILLPTESVIHVVAVPGKVDEYFSNSRVEKLCVTGSEYSSLIRFISNSFYKSENRKILELKSGLYGNSQFYKGIGRFYFLNTCNKWTAKGLKSAGMNIFTAFKLTADSVINDVKKLKQANPEYNCKR